MGNEIDELRHEVKELREDKIRRDGFIAGAKSTVQHVALVCGLLWSFIMLMVNLFGDFAYNHIPMVKQIVDIVNGAK